ncbi:MAG: DUF1330 domain-containing protein [Hyphomicrobiaceae bacterium]
MGAGYVNPTRDQFKAIFGLPLDEPVLMINLLRFRPVAEYVPDDAEYGEPAVSGAEAYRRYSAAATPVFDRVGGAQAWIGRPELVLIGPADESWDLAFIARYPTAQSFIDMLRDADYQRAVRHRNAAVADSRLIRCGELPAGRTFRPG